MDTENSSQVRINEPAQKSSKKALVLALLLGIAVLISGVFLYLWMNESSETSRLEKSLAESNQQVETLSQKVQTTSDDAKVTPDNETTATDDESEAIVKAVGAYAHARVAGAEADLSIQIVKKELPFVRVAVNLKEEMGGYSCVLKQPDGLWVVLFCGQSPPLQSELDQWGVPESILQS